jgi:hypothetical protein
MADSHHSAEVKMHLAITSSLPLSVWASDPERLTLHPGQRAVLQVSIDGERTESVIELNTITYQKVG